MGVNIEHGIEHKCYSFAEPIWMNQSDRLPAVGSEVSEHYYPHLL